MMLIFAYIQFYSGLMNGVGGGNNRRMRYCFGLLCMIAHALNNACRCNVRIMFISRSHQRHTHIISYENCHRRINFDLFCVSSMTRNYLDPETYLGDVILYYLVLAKPINIAYLGC